MIYLSFISSFVCFCILFDFYLQLKEIRLNLDRWRNSSNHYRRLADYNFNKAFEYKQIVESNDLDSYQDLPDSDVKPKPCHLRLVK